MMRKEINAKEANSLKGWRVYHIGKGRWVAIKRTEYKDYTLETTSPSKLKEKIDFYG